MDGVNRASGMLGMQPARPSRNASCLSYKFSAAPDKKQVQSSVLYDLLNLACIIIAEVLIRFEGIIYTILSCHPISIISDKKIGLVLFGTFTPAF